MPVRRRSRIHASLALAASLLVVASAALVASPALAQAPAPAPAQPAPGSPPAPPPAPAEPRAPLVSPAPSATPAADPSATAGTPVAPPSAAAGTAGMAGPVQTISPSRDQQQLSAQGGQRPSSVGDPVGSPREVFAEDWWNHAKPVIEIHGYFRTRAELFHNFSLGRSNTSVTGGDNQYLWPLPLDQNLTQGVGGPGQTVTVCGSNPQPNSACNDKTESGANLRFRLNPEIHISDNLRILSQVDLLDNLVLGSTPNSYATQPGTTSTQTGYVPVTAGTGYAPVNYAPISFLSTTQGVPTAGVNGFTNSVSVQRVWGEYMTPVGQLRFGRMPDQWGLGIVANAGNGIDSDYQSNVDRIMFVTGIKSMDLYFGGAWDFPSTGPTNANPFDVYGGQPYNTCNLCNVNEWVAFLVHKTNPEIQRLKLSRGEFVLNGGIYTVYRSQYVDLQKGETPWSTPYGVNSEVSNNGLEPRQAWAVIPDAWVQAMWRKLRFEAEAVTIQGQLGYLAGFNNNINNPATIRQYGLATQTEFRAIDDKLDLQFGFGWASGDAYANNAGTNALQPSSTGFQNEFTSGGSVAPISTFRFHPDYRIDLIFWRNIMSRVEGAYYFRPSVDYDFLRHPDGEKFGGGAAVIWSRASEFIQTPGHKSDLGVELDLQLYYQSKDGSLNDDPTKIGGFYTMLQYGVFFPLGGLGYLPNQTTGLSFDTGLSAAQTVRLFLGIAF
jgi:uncharacterized protein (TIGR04551 family)